MRSHRRALSVMSCMSILTIVEPSSVMSDSRFFSASTASSVVCPGLRSAVYSPVSYVWWSRPSKVV